MNKKGKLSSGVANTAVVVIVILAILLEAAAILVPTAGNAGGSMNDSSLCEADGCFWNTTTADTGVNRDNLSNNCRNATGNVSETNGCVGRTIPLGNLFSPTGIIFVIVMAALLILIVKGLLQERK